MRQKAITAPGVAAHFTSAELIENATTAPATATKPLPGAVLIVTSSRLPATCHDRSMRLNLTADELLSTTRSVRKRLDFDRPVERQIVEECFELALQAPTGSNRQGWQFVVVEDDEIKRQIAEIYAANFYEYAAMPRPEYGESDTRTDRGDAVASSASYLADNFHRVPLMMIPCIEGRLDNAGVMMGASAWGSLLPAVWSFMLALRERGLGSAWTTLHMLHDGEQRVAELVGIPADKYSQGGLFPIAYTKGTDFKPAPRLPLDNVVHWARW